MDTIDCDVRVPTHRHLRFKMRTEKNCVMAGVQLELENKLGSEIHGGAIWRMEAEGPTKIAARTKERSSES